MTDGARCSIEGCIRETSRPTQVWICSVHWKRYCPPHSRRRRAYLSFFRQAKRHGWHWRGPTGRGPTLDARFWQFWSALVRLANTVEKGDRFDMTEVNKLFGWDD